MAAFFGGVFVFLIGAFMTAAEVPACEYERSNLGPPIALIGILIAIGSIVEAIL